MINYPVPETFGQYAALAAQTDRFSGDDALALAMQGILGEAGSVLAAVKKHRRDRLSFEAHKQTVLEEIGDTLWYLASVARHAGLSLIEVAARLPASRLPSPVAGDDIPFSAIYELDVVEDFEEDEPYMEELAKFGSEVGFLLSLPLDPLDPYQIRGQLASAMGELITVAHLSGFTLTEVAQSNLEKTFSRWPTAEYRVFDVSFDAAAPPYEQLPHELSVDIRLVEPEAGKYFVYQTVNGVHVGDRLTDNITDQDYYRYHDAFHYAYAAVLHWSPVLRALLKVKRKHDEGLDRDQDGARAAIIEEAITAYVFSRAKAQGYFEGVRVGSLSYDLLKVIQDLTRGYEVEVCPLWLWEEAILQGYDAFRTLKELGSGRVKINRKDRSISVEALA